jgi:two-component system LytT family sensor kinase
MQKATCRVYYETKAVTRIMTTINYVNASLEIWGCIMSAVVAVCLFMSGRQHEITNRLYLRMLFCHFCILFFDVLALFFRGKINPLCWWGVRISNFIAFSSSYLLMMAFSDYLTAFLGARGPVSERPRQICRLLSIIGLCLLVVNLFFPLIYSVDAGNIYHRESFFWFSHILGIAGLLANSWLVLVYNDKTDPQEEAALWTYMILPILALTVQIFSYGIVLANLSYTIALVVIFIFIQAEQGRYMAEQEKRLQHSRVMIMLSQIQPHFLYNALNSISYLCKKDPAAAQAAVNDFAVYLRSNLDSISRTEPIPFEKELEHVKTYLSLEKMRFGDEVNFSFDIEAASFLVPALSVQPLVENAVKHGLGETENGGTVTIATREKKDCYEITVTDDGVGFDPSRVKNDGRTHVGMQNVKERLETICGGTLTISSQPGQGTRAVITIPKTQ